MNKQEAITIWEEYKSMNLSRDMIEEINQRWYQHVITLYKELLGKKISSFEKAYQKLVSEGFKSNLKDAIKPYEDEVSVIYDNFKFKKESLENQLKDFSNDYTPEKSDQIYLLKTKESWAYSTQPSHNKYAKEALTEDVLLLNLLGFETEVKAVNGHMSGGMYPSYWEDYQLWSNLTEFDFQMLTWSGEFISVLNWAVLCWRKGTNPKVYFQFLSDDDYQKSQVLFSKHYQITRENMKLEPSWDEINAMS